MPRLAPCGPSSDITADGAYCGATQNVIVAIRCGAVRLAGKKKRDCWKLLGRADLPRFYPFFVLSLDVGLRSSESRSLRRANIRIKWQGGSRRGRRDYRRAFEDRREYWPNRSAHATSMRGAYNCGCRASPMRRIIPTSFRSTCRHCGQ